MPNQNPSGPNQPLSQHPLTANKRVLLGGDAQLVENMVEATLYQLIPPPPAGVVREVSGTLCAGINIGAGAADVTDLQLLYIDSSGKEYLLATDAGPIVAGTDVPFAWIFPFFLLEEDGGIFVRFAGGAGGNITGRAAWYDVRGVERQVTNLVTGVPATLVPAAEEGTALFLHGSQEVPGSQPIYANFDTAAMDILFELYNGIISVPIATLAVAAAAATPGVLTALDATANVCTVIPPGWELRATLETALTTGGPVEVFTFFGRTNQAPVRPDQGGAY